MAGIFHLLMQVKNVFVVSAPDIWHDLMKAGADRASLLQLYNLKLGVQHIIMEQYRIQDYFVEGLNIDGSELMNQHLDQLTRTGRVNLHGGRTKEKLDDLIARNAKERNFGDYILCSELKAAYNIRQKGIPVSFSPTIENEIGCDITGEFARDHMEKVSEIESMMNIGYIDPQILNAPGLKDKIKTDYSDLKREILVYHLEKYTMGQIQAAKAKNFLISVPNDWKFDKSRIPHSKIYRLVMNYIVGQPGLEGTTKKSLIKPINNFADQAGLKLGTIIAKV
jgi:hypothetical protein